MASTSPTGTVSGPINALNTPSNPSATHPSNARQCRTPTPPLASGKGGGSDTSKKLPAGWASSCGITACSTPPFRHHTCQANSASGTDPKIHPSAITKSPCSAAVITLR